MNELIVKERRKVLIMDTYDGVCEKCGSPVILAESGVVIEIYRDERQIVVVPADWLECPHCGVQADTMRIWLDMNVTKELAVTSL